MKDNFFGNKLKELRIEKGLSQRKLGEILGFCNQTVSFWEQGRTEPNISMLRQLSEIFNVSVDYLLGRED